jgi:hypothetical protein
MVGTLRFAHPTAVMPRECGASSTLRLLDSVTAASGILDHPPSRVMTRRRSRGMFCPSFSKFVCPFPKRGRRECRVRAAPAVSCAICAKESAHEHTGERRTLRHPLRNGFTAYFVLSPVSGLVVTVTSRKTFPQGLMPASRRQDHTTWPYALVQPSAEQKRPSQSRPYVFVAIAKRPSGGPGCATPANDLPDVTSGNIFSRGA